MLKKMITFTINIPQMLAYIIHGSYGLGKSTITVHKNPSPSDSPVVVTHRLRGAEPGCREPTFKRHGNQKSPGHVKSGWWLLLTPPKNHGVSSSVGMMTFPTEWENKSHGPNHQPV